MKNLLRITLILCLLSSCISQKKLTYFQGEPTENEIESFSEKPYRLQVDDILYVNIKANNPELVTIFNSRDNTRGNINTNTNDLYFTGYSVDIHGMIDLPIIGEINVLGYKVDEVRTMVFEKLEKYFKEDSNLFVEVKLYGIKYTILGEIGGAGTKVVNQNRLNVVEAIANAGDITIYGNRKHVEVFRLEDGRMNKYEVDMTDITAFESDVFQILPNDIIFIPPLKQKSWGTGTNTIQTITTLISVFSLITSTYLLAQSLL